MKTERFIAYLRYRECFAEEMHQHFSIFRCQPTRKTCYVPTKDEDLPADVVVFYCRSLGIPVPDIDEILAQEKRM